MRERRSRLPQWTLLVGVVLVVVILDSGLAEAAQLWDAAQSTQGLVVLGGFTLALVVGLALLARRGFRRVVVVQGGTTAWLANGWPVEVP